MPKVCASLLNCLSQVLDTSKLPCTVTYDKEFNRLAQTFGMTAEYARLKGETDHNVLPDVRRSQPDQAFDTTQDSKKIQVHPTDPNKTTSIAVNLDPA
jgi:hypothetical protein